MLINQQHLIHRILEKEKETIAWRLEHAKRRNAAIEVETTSYALMWLMMEETEEQLIVEIVSWLVDQISSEGGFHSTQDTIIGKGCCNTIMLYSLLKLLLLVASVVVVGNIVVIVVVVNIVAVVVVVVFLQVLNLISS